MHLPTPDPVLNVPLEFLAANRHLQAVEGILHDIVGVQLVAFADDLFGVLLNGFREEEELGPRRSLKAAQEEAGGLQRLDAGRVSRSCYRAQILGDGVDSVECASEDEVVIARESVEAGMKGAVVDEAASFVDDEKRVDDPASCVSWWSLGISRQGQRTC